MESICNRKNTLDLQLLHLIRKLGVEEGAIVTDLNKRQNKIGSTQKNETCAISQCGAETRFFSSFVRFESLTKERYRLSRVSRVRF